VAPVNNTAAGHGPFGSITTTGTAAVALTFDDGPFAYTGQVLDLLAQYHIKATFCVIGKQVPGNAELIRRIVAEGHTLCNHTWTHDLTLRLRSTEQIRAEMQRTNDAIHAIVPDVPVKYFREPGGAWGANTVSMATSLGMTSIHWAVDPTDWKRPPPQAIINNVLGHTGPGSIVLMHDGGGERSNTIVALRTILPNLASRFTLVPLPTS
jgi:peptidoglycan/xylan/chitin deacetylase (PgdA/CDA1 family)